MPSRNYVYRIDHNIRKNKLLFTELLAQCGRETAETIAYYYMLKALYPQGFNNIYGTLFVMKRDTGLPVERLEDLIKELEAMKLFCINKSEKNYGAVYLNDKALQYIVKSSLTGHSVNEFLYKDLRSYDVHSQILRMGGIEKFNPLEFQLE